MNNNKPLVKKIRDYKLVIKFLDCANYVYLDEINNFDFKKISKYNKSKYLYNKITHDFILVNELIDKQDLLNASTVLRTLYENIIYIIAKSYNRELNITLDTEPRELRKTLENNCNEIFTDYFEKKDFNVIYKYLCKLVHPSSMKELLSYMSKISKYKKYLLNNLKYIMLVIEYMFLNFLNKKSGKEASEFDLEFIDICTCINIYNINWFLTSVKDSKSFIRRYFYYDTTNKYILDQKNQLSELNDLIKNNKELIDVSINELIYNLDKKIKNSKYSEIINTMLKDV